MLHETEVMCVGLAFSTPYILLPCVQRFILGTCR